jgi:hypothetical protein
VSVCECVSVGLVYHAHTHLSTPHQTHSPNQLTHKKEKKKKKDIMIMLCGCVLGVCVAGVRGFTRHAYTHIQAYSDNLLCAQHYVIAPAWLRH